MFLQVRGTDYKTADGTCIGDYIDVTDLVDAHVKLLRRQGQGKLGSTMLEQGEVNYFLLHNQSFKMKLRSHYPSSASTGRSVKEFVEVCKAATRVPIKVDFLPRRPGDYAEVYSDPTKIQNELNWSQIH